MSIFKKGHIPWNKGKKYSNGFHFSKEQKDRMSKIAKGRIKSEEWRKNISIGMNNLSPEVKRRKALAVSKAQKGRVSQWKGKKLPYQVWMKGKHHTEEAKEKNRLAHKNIHSKEHYKKIGLKGAKVLYKRQPTSIEIKVYDELKRRGLLFEAQYIVNNKFVVDVYIPSLNLIIEADGKYWHNLERIQKKDKAENAYLTKCGFNLMRWQEADINTDIKSLFNQIRLN